MTNMTNMTNISWYCNRCGTQNPITTNKCNSCDNIRSGGPVPNLQTAFSECSINNGIVINNPTYVQPNNYELVNDDPKEKSLLMRIFLWICTAMLYVGTLAMFSLVIFVILLLYKAFTRS